LLEVAIKPVVEDIEDIEFVTAANQEVYVLFGLSAKRQLQLERTAQELKIKLKRFVTRHGIRWQDSLMRGSVVVLENWRAVCTQLSVDAAAQIGKDTNLLTPPEDFVMRRVKVSFNVEGSNRLYTGKVLLYMGELRDYTDHEDDFCGSSAPEYQAWFTTGTEADTAPENYFVVHFSHDNTWQHMSLGEIHSALMAGRLTAFKESSAGALYMKLTSERYLFASYLVSDVRAVTKQCSMAFQNDELDLNSFNDSLDEVDRKLAQLKVKDGPMLSAFRKDSNEASNSFEGIETNDDEVHSNTLRPVLCDRMRSALRESFKSIRDNQSLQDADVFRHEKILLLDDAERNGDGVTELEAYGQDAIKRLTEKFAVSLHVMGVQMDEILPQWQRFKRWILKPQQTGLARKSYSDMWDWMTTHRSDTMDPGHFYDLLCLVVLVRNWMLDTSCCERGFSIMNLLRSPVRNRLSQELCRALMTIALIGGEKYKHPSTVPVDEIYKVWMEQKKRYSVGSDAELWGQKGWDEVMKKMRQMRDGSLSDSDGE